MYKLFFKNMSLLLSMFLVGCILIYISVRLYIIVGIVFVAICALTGIGRKTWIPTYSRYMRNINIDITSTTKGYTLGVVLNLGGYALPYCMLMLYKYFI